MKRKSLNTLEKLRCFFGNNKCIQIDRQIACGGNKFKDLRIFGAPYALHGVLQVSNQLLVSLIMLGILVGLRTRRVFLTKISKVAHY